MKSKKIRTQERQQKTLKKPGLPPGTLVFTGKRKVDQITMKVTLFNEDEVYTETFSGGNVDRIKHGSRMTWIDVTGIHDVSMIEAFGRKYDINHLLLEDILDVDQIPKYIDLDNANFLTFQSFNYDRENVSIVKEQISIFFNDHVILSFQEDAPDTFRPIYERIENSKSRFRSRKPDYLAYALMDLTVDKYMEAIQYFEDRIDEFELKIEKDPNKELKQDIFKFRRIFLTFLKSITPIQEAIIKFKSSGSEAIHGETRVYLADLLDHTLQVVNLADTYNEMIYVLYDLFHAEINYRSNNVIRTLTVISTIFIPLTFIVGIYGMNFRFMPELEWYYGYPAVWIFMIVFTVVTLIYFKVKRWL